ncbi:MAG: UbiA family prenyltransferase [Thermoplasmata archaeon]|nr:UbiA family prenyltransferase [Thermoplasmata archaeon]
MKEWFQIIRPLNAVMSGVSVLIVTLSLGKSLLNILVVLGFIVTFLTTAGGNVLNDYFDREVDIINHPERPIPSGKISPSKALIYAGVLFSISLFVAIFIGLVPFLIDILAIFLLYIYESKTKNIGIYGNITISFLLLMLFIFTGSIFNKYELPLILGSMAFFATLGREITKDVEDMAGDFNRKTLPKKIGKGNALLIASIFYLIGILISSIPYVFHYFGLYYIIAVAVADIIFIYAAIIQFKSPHKGQNAAKYAMILGLISYIIGGISK